MNPLISLTANGGADLPQDPTTAVSLTFGTPVTATLGTDQDIDWFSLTLEAGAQVSIRVTGSSPFVDPYLTLFDAAEVVLAEDDDSNGLNPALEYTAPVAQTIYVSVDSADFFEGSGNYTVTVESLFDEPDEPDTEILYTEDPLAVIDWGTALADSTVTYVFAPSGYMANGYTAEAVTAYEQAQFRAVFDRIEAVSALTFTEVASPANADFVLMVDTDEIVGEFLGEFGPPGEVGAGIGLFDATQWDRIAGGTLAAGGDSFQTVMHEVLHGLGLAHPHDDGGGSPVFVGVFEGFDQFGTFDLNQGIFTSMSYNTGFLTGSSGSAPDAGLLWGSDIGPMALDIAVLQDKYGANTATGSGADLYILPGGNGPGTGWRAIWDNGGFDVIRYDGAGDATIDLRAATLRGEIGGGGFVSSVTGIAGGFTIANGVVIEMAQTGSGNDTLTGNTADNRLSGGNGNDRLDGGGGNDSLQGGQGFDTIHGDAGNDTVIGLGGFDLIDGGDGADSLQGNFGNDTIMGLAGNDTLEGGLGFDSMMGGNGADFLQARDGFDTLIGGAGNDTLEGNNGNDSLMGGADDDRLEGGLGSDILSGGLGNDLLLGANGFDILNGDAGNDTLEGNFGNDTMDGGAGNDVLRGGLGADTFIYTGGMDRIVDYQPIDRIQISSDLLPEGVPIADLARDDAAGNALLDLGNGNVLTIMGSPVFLDDLIFA